jgi:hypothetical protein
MTEDDELRRKEALRRLQPSPICYVGKERRRMVGWYDALCGAKQDARGHLPSTTKRKDLVTCPDCQELMKALPRS